MYLGLAITDTNNRVVYHGTLWSTLSQKWLCCVAPVVVLPAKSWIRLPPTSSANFIAFVISYRRRPRLVQHPLSPPALFTGHRNLSYSSTHTSSLCGQERGTSAAHTIHASPPSTLGLTLDLLLDFTPTPRTQHSSAVIASRSHPPQGLCIFFLPGESSRSPPSHDSRPVLGVDISKHAACARQAHTFQLPASKGEETPLTLSSPGIRELPPK